MNQIKSKDENHVFIIAEMSSNHNQNIDTAKNTIKTAKEVGADAIKLQTFTPNTMTIDSDKEYFKLTQGTLWDGTTLYKLYKKSYIPYKWHKELFEYAYKIGIDIFSTPFDKTAVDLLEDLNTPMYKIASFEMNDIPLLEYTASKGKPMLLSTGVATISDIEEAINACKRVGNNDITLLKCTTTYPTPFDEVNLLTIQNMKETFNIEVGISDHSLGNAVSVAAVALGAKVVERHFIIDRDIDCPDSSFSLNPEEFGSLVKDIRAVEKALGKITYELTENQIKNKQHSRSLFVIKDIKKGDIITEENVLSIRPAFGMHPRYYKEILGKKFNCNLEKGTPMDWKYIQ